MKRRFEFEIQDAPSILERLVGALAAGHLRRVAAGLREDLLRSVDRASVRAVACLVAAALLIVAVILLVNAGLLGLIAMQVPPAAASLALGLAALAGGWLLLRIRASSKSPHDPENSD